MDLMTECFCLSLDRVSAAGCAESRSVEHLSTTREEGGYDIDSPSLTMEERSISGAERIAFCAMIMSTVLWVTLTKALKRSLSQAMKSPAVIDGTRSL